MRVSGTRGVAESDCSCAPEMREVNQEGLQANIKGVGDMWAPTERTEERRPVTRATRRSSGTGMAEGHAGVRFECSLDARALSEDIRENGRTAVKQPG
ncbi:hypothetical protein NDU88_007764 [Pleurodeles waltl]|uniref:Uncharacterized protein n=1 Tax=Pleurodeles waltl TaxID=8319 RepID=A0AAV7NVU1_PLEWA|nr:hypothetical protein NDU88_007764 [Pleurodeles waltl]